VPRSQVVHARPAAATAGSTQRSPSARPSLGCDDLQFQDRVLPGVSRTFALTIPQLPRRLGLAVTNAYLLCRIADTIEDDAALDPEEKAALHEDFLGVLAGTADAPTFATVLESKLSPGTPAAEQELVLGIPQILHIMNGLSEKEVRAIRSCLAVMCGGMDQYSRGRGPGGLANVRALERYCYFVAGVVGEMLTELFCAHSAEIAAHHDELMSCAVSFGEGLQMTNILKDVWEDLEQGTCWLPRDVFDLAGRDLSSLRRLGPDAAFAAGMQELVAIAHVKLRDALRYTLLIPRHEAGIRRFLAWAIGLALLTLQRIHGTPCFTRGAQVKVTRRTVKALVVVTSASIRSNATLQALFSLSARGLPLPAPEPSPLGARHALPFPTTDEQRRRRLR
jgi:farnesyl-diphosphate farnesyltransferase